MPLEPRCRKCATLKSGQIRGFGQSSGLGAHYYGYPHPKRWAVSGQNIPLPPPAAANGQGDWGMDNSRIDDIARRLFEGLPEAARTMRRDIESNFRAVLQSTLGKLDLTTREEFEVQTKVLERTRARIEQLELRIVTLEQRLSELEEAIPPASD